MNKDNDADKRPRVYGMVKEDIEEDDEVSKSYD